MSETESKNARRDFSDEQNLSAKKKAARSLARSLLKSLGAAERKAQSQKAALSFINSTIYKNADCLAAFYSLPDEIDTLPIIARFFLDKKRVFLPRIVFGSNQMEFYEIASPFDLANNSALILAVKAALEAQTEPNAWKIREPLLSLPTIEKKKMPARTAILVPGLAFSKDGRRLGRGKGFYDRYLSELMKKNEAFRREGKICGYCFDFQIVDDIPIEENDVLMQAVFF
mgnify:CR=1 FL=1